MISNSQLPKFTWTDHNESDSGVVTLEQLFYALSESTQWTDLHFRAFLACPGKAKAARHRQALFSPRTTFSCNPVTLNDQRKFLLSQLPEVGNLWLVPYRSPASAKGINGLYEVELYFPGLKPSACIGGKGELEESHQQIRTVYYGHRSLCEDLRSIHILRPVRANVHAEVNILELHRPEALLAVLLYGLGNLLAPEPRRRPLKSLIDQGLTPSAIFEGPLLHNGFIDDSQLQPKATEFPLSEIARLLARAEGVATIRNLKVRVGDATYSGNDSIPVPARDILQLETKPDRHGRFSIRLFRNGAELYPNPAQVQRELDKLWAEHRRTYPLDEQYDEFFPPPKGKARDLRSYFSIQNHFPNAYGINASGLPSDATPERKGQAKQLKGYLLVFEQLMANFLAQLEGAKDLFSIDPALRQSYFFQSLAKLVPNVEPLLKKGEGGYEEGLPRIVQGQDPFVERRNRFLDFLLALHGQKLDAASVASPPGFRDGEDPGEYLIAAKLDLLENLVESSRDRGKGIDYLARPSPKNITGMEIKCRIQLGLKAFGHRPLIDVLDELAVILVERETEASVGRPVGRFTEAIEEELDLLAEDPESGEASAGGALPRGITVPEKLLEAAEQGGEIRVGQLPGEQAFAVVWKSPAEDHWRLLAKHADGESAQASGRAFAELLGTLQRYCRQLYIVEHTLLRFGRYREGGDQFVYSFTITAVVSIEPRLRGFVRHVIRENTPAHIVARYCFLRPGQIRAFEELYWDWRRALEKQDRRGRIITSARLRQYLQKHTEEPVEAPE